VAAGSGEAFGAFGLQARVVDGALRGVTFAGREIVRLIDMPIRDADWGTLPTETVSIEVTSERLRRAFRTLDGGFAGSFAADVTATDAGVRLEARVEITALREVRVNRVGFILLHPLRGVVGEAVEVRHADGRIAEARFPVAISPGQPVRDIAGLSHRVEGVAVDIAFAGDVFEMEDQRNWTDASFKTYCRPLALPRPYAMAVGEVVRQEIIVTVTGGGAEVVPARAAPERARMPEIMLAHEPSLTGPAVAGLEAVAAGGVLWRWRAGDAPAPVAGPVTLEIVTGDPAADIARAAAAGIAPARVVALPEGYLASHQPEGPWPAARPMELVPLVRAAFAGAEAGGGMLTNFTEFNRCPPDPAQVDFVTFGTTAIVHAADDASVIETLEAVPQVIGSAQALAEGRPLRLGLMAMGMRSNPYGATVAANPEGRRLPMAMDDPRQRTGFAAAFAVALAAVCARGGVVSMAPAMTAGPLGMADGEEVWPIWHAVAAMAALAGAEVEVTEGTLVTIRGKGRRGVAGVVANIGTVHVSVAGAVLVPARGPRDWIDRRGVAGEVVLAPMTAAVLG
jgi:hypothetical protein